MIVSFACKETAKIYAGYVSRKLPHAIQETALRKLQMMDAVITLNDLRVPPANHLEALKGNRKGQYSIRINRQYRICFFWTNKGPAGVQIVDYH
jgi:proteic killer suppression protein